MLQDEQELCKVLLNKPSDKFLVEIDPDWIQNTEIRKIISAVINVQNFDGLSNFTEAVWNLANEGSRYKTISLKHLKEIQAAYLTDAFLEKIVNNIHRDYLKALLNADLQTASKAPTPSLLDEIDDLIKEIKAVSDTTDSGSIQGTIDELENQFDKVPAYDIKTFPKLDELLGGGLYGGCLMTIGGTPGTGKTTMAINIAYQSIQNNDDVRVDYFTKEMIKREIYNRFVSRYTGINSYKLRPSKVHSLWDDDKKLVRRADEYYRNSGLRIYSKCNYVDEVAKIIISNSAKCEKGKYLAIVDYIGLFHSRKNSFNKVAEISDITGTLKGLTSDLEVPIIELSQLNRSVTSREDKKPLLSDLRDSGSIEQDSNVVALLYNPFKNDDTIVAANVAKNREGACKQLMYAFNKGGMRFNETDYEG